MSPVWFTYSSTLSSLPAYRKMGAPAAAPPQNLSYTKYRCWYRPSPPSIGGDQSKWSKVWL